MSKNEKLKKERKTILENQLAQQRLALQFAERDIYENISQCLCLARLQLGHIDLKDKQNALKIIGEANLLIGKAVRDLRNLANQLAKPAHNQEN